MVVTVCVWSPWTATDRSGRVVDAGIGHASLRMGGQYLSFWPGATASFTPAGALQSVPCAFQNFDQDKRAERGLPDLVTHLKNLDENSISVFIQRIFANKPPYHVKFFNCSHAIKIALYEGTGRKIDAAVVSADPRAYPVTQQLPSFLQGGKVEEWIKATWNPLDIDKYAKQILKALG